MLSPTNSQTTEGKVNEIAKQKQISSDFSVFMIFWLLFFFYHFKKSKLEWLSFSIVVLIWIVKCVSFLVCLILVCIVAKNVRFRPQIHSILSVLSLSHTFFCG
jgi:hypothetical protein